MKYSEIIKGEFISRPNRFIAEVKIGNEIHTVHVKNTGRCKEILLTGATVYLEKSKNPHRKTQYDLIAVEKATKNGPKLINLDSQIPNACAEEFLPLSGIVSTSAELKREVKYGNSRFDLFAKDGDKKMFFEVKGVTLERDGTALFPDAPTERGVKHIRELIKALKDGYEAYIFFVIQMPGISRFCPNKDTHPEFAEALKNAAASGVRILAYECDVTPDSIEITKPVTVDLF